MYDYSYSSYEYETVTSPWIIYSDTIIKVVIENGVNNIGDYAFCNLRFLEVIEIPNSVAHIGNYSFQYCYNLESVFMPHVTDIGDYSFYNCKALSDVKFSNGMESIGQYAFGYCKKLDNVKIPNSVTTIGADAFSYCKTLSKVKLSSNMTELSVGVFRGCEKLYNIDIPSNITVVGNAFVDSGLKEIKLHDNITSVGGFTGCKNLTYIEIPDSVTELGYFSGCSSLESINIPDGISNIGWSMFYGCSNLKCLSIPETVTTIGGLAFGECSNLSDVFYSGDEKHWNVIKVAPLENEPLESVRVYFNNKAPIMFDANGGTGAPAIQYKEFRTDLVLPDVIPVRDELTFIGWADEPDAAVAKYQAGGVYSENKAATLYAVWSDCYIASGSCGDKLSWTLDETGLLSIKGTGPMYNYSYSGYEDDVTGESVETVTSQWWGNRHLITSVDIDIGVTNIGDYAFLCCDNLAKVIIPDTIKRIGSGSFCRCLSIHDIAIPNSVTTIGAISFSGTSLAEIQIPNSVTEIGNWAFFGCRNLVSASIGKGLTEFEMDGGLFNECTSLKSVIIDPQNPNYLSIDGVVYNKLGTLLVFCPEGKTGYFRIPNHVNEIGFCAFSNCKNLSRIFIPDSISIIGYSAFTGCTGIERIVIPNSVIRIAGSAFMGCDKLTEIVFMHSANDILDVWWGAFGSHLTDSIATTVRVPDTENINPAISEYDWGDSNRTVTYEKSSPLANGWEISYCLADDRADNSNNLESYEYFHDDITLASPTLNGYTFAGWYLNESCTIRAAEPQIRAEDTGAKTFYAKWTMNTYSIKFSSNGGTGSMATLTKKTDKSGEIAVSNKLKRTGYKFTEWNTAADGSGESFGSTLTIYELAPYADAKNVITLYAQWQPIEYTVVFDANGGNGVIEPVTLKYGESWTVAENTFDRTGYTPNAWKCGSKTYKNGQSVKNLSTQDGATVTLTAQWKVETTYKGYNYKITFNGNGSNGGKTNAEAMKVGTAKALTSNGFTKTGYHFIGWATTEEGDVAYTNKQSVQDLNILLNPEPDRLILEAVELYAVWEKNTYKVTFNGNGGKLGKATSYTQTLTYDTEAALDANGFEKAGYSFKQWNTKADGKGTAYADSAEVMNLSFVNNGKVSLYAIWKYSVTLNPGTGEGVAAEYELTYGQSETVNPDGFSRKGYCIAGWNTDAAKAAKGTVQYKANAVKNIKPGTTLYAVWKPITYKVVFHINNGTDKTKTQTLTYDKQTALTANGFTWKGHTFQGWRTEDSINTYANKEKVSNLASEQGAEVHLYAIWN